MEIFKIDRIEMNFISIFVNPKNIYKPIQKIYTDVIFQNNNKKINATSIV